jgi:DNA sulfur modification protein DndB
VREIELFFKDDIRDRLKQEFGSDWLKKGLPRKIHLEAANLATAKNLDRSSGEELGPWDCLHLIDYKEIVSQNSDLWSRRFAKQYTRPGDEHVSGGFKARSNWMIELNRIRNENDHTYSVKEDEYNFLVELKRWLLDGEIENEVPG